MNGYNNPNESFMGNFGAKKNYMKHDNNDNVNLNDLLPEDPYKKQQKSKWVKESVKNHEKKQHQIAQQQAQFVPDSFKNANSNMYVDVQTTNVQKVNANPSNMARNNNHIMRMNQSPPKQIQQQQPTQLQSQQQQQQHMPQKGNNYHNDHHSMQQQQQRFNNANPQNGHNGNKHNEPQRKGVVDKPMAQPYFSKKADDPFSKYLQKQHPIKKQQKQLKPRSNMNSNANNLNKNNSININNQISPHIKDQPQFFCAVCGKPIANEWTEDSKQRKYHNSCFVCVECGISLGSVGKYIKCAKGMTCRICRDKQISQQNAVKY